MHAQARRLAHQDRDEQPIAPPLEKPLLSLERAMDIDSFWRAVQQLLSAAVPARVIGLSFQSDPVSPIIARWSRSMPEDFFAVEPLRNYAARLHRKKLVRLSDIFPVRASLVHSAFYRRYLLSRKCAHYSSLFFWRRNRFICAIAILRSAEQGDLSPAEQKLLQQLYPHLRATLRRLESLEQERLVRADLEEFLRRLPLPTIILRWNLKPLYQNRAAREFCAVWEKGPEEAKRTKATSPIPSEILERCRVLKKQVDAQPKTPPGQRRNFREEHVHHPRFANLRATIQLKQIKSAGVARPHFLIACEDFCRNGKPAPSHLPLFARLTRREREVAEFACEGHSNKEIAQKTCLSVQSVKKHLHAVFRKLEVPSRARLVALMA
jgi:DNA-binding CsgD family transcriptional regulator